MQYWHAKWLESSFFLSRCLSNHMAGTDQCYMDLMYVSNTGVQMSKVHSYDSIATDNL